VGAFSFQDRRGSDAARIAEDAGIAGLTLHARTTAQHYSGSADWGRIAELAEATSLPVLGNGDVFEVEDAVRLMAETGCAGVAVGRGCQGRPWLFRELAARLHGCGEVARPGLSDVVAMIERHGQLSYEHFNGDEHRAMRELRKHIGWYLQALCGDRQPDEATEALRRAINDCEQADGQVRLLERYFADRASLLDTGIDQGGIQPS